MNILDRSFKYTPSHKTDIRKLYAKVRRELRVEKDARDANPEKEGKLLRFRALARRA